MKKLVLTALTGLSAMLLLTGCEEEQTDTTLKSSTNATITKKLAKQLSPN